MTQVICGIDLAGLETNKTGFAILCGKTAITKVLFSDEEIMREVLELEPVLISIDAPLGKPRGKGKIRVCEKQLAHMGIHVFPCMFSQMKKLTERGIRLAESLRKNGFLVIESYPSSAQHLLGIPKKKNPEALQKGLVTYGITGDVTKKSITDHELDAITSAVVGQLYLAGKTVAIGKAEEGLMIIPKQQHHPTMEEFEKETTG